MTYSDSLTIPSTNTGGTYSIKPPVVFLMGLYLLTGLSTGTAVASSEPINPIRDYTSSKLNVFQSYENHAQNIYELRRKTGLTWDKIAELFGVSKRSVHFWANGKPMEDYRDEKLYSLVMVIRKMDTGFSVQNRRLLLAKDEAGFSLFDLLKKGDFYSANLRIPLAGIKQVYNLKPLSSKARAELEPLISPFDLLNADDSRIEAKKAKVSTVSVRKAKHKS